MHKRLSPKRLIMIILNDGEKHPLSIGYKEIPSEIIITNGSDHQIRVSATDRGKPRIRSASL